jgi:transcriptional regulator with XRE-family HTH domain
MTTNIGRQVREARERRGLTQREVARRSDLSANTVNRIEQGLVKPASATIERLARTLNVSPGSLYCTTPVRGGLPAKDLALGAASLELDEEQQAIRRAAESGLAQSVMSQVHYGARESLRMRDPIELADALLEVAKLYREAEQRLTVYEQEQTADEELVNRG